MKKYIKNIIIVYIMISTLVGCSTSDQPPISTKKIVTLEVRTGNNIYSQKPAYISDIVKVKINIIDNDGQKIYENEELTKKDEKWNGIFKLKLDAQYTINCWAIDKDGKSIFIGVTTVVIKRNTDRISIDLTPVALPSELPKITNIISSGEIERGEKTQIKILTSATKGTILNIQFETDENSNEDVFTPSSGEILINSEEEHSFITIYNAPDQIGSYKYSVSLTNDYPGNITMAYKQEFEMQVVEKIINIEDIYLKISPNIIKVEITKNTDNEILIYVKTENEDVNSPLGYSCKFVSNEDESVVFIEESSNPCILKIEEPTLNSIEIAVQVEDERELKTNIKLLLPGEYFADNVLKQEKVDLISSKIDWVPNDYKDSQGILNSYYSDKKIIFEVDLDPTVESKRNGEVFVWFDYIFGLRDQVPIDFSNKDIKVKIRLNDDFKISRTYPFGLQVIAESANNNKKFYSGWANLSGPGEFENNLNSKFSGSWTESGWDRTKISRVGIKIGTQGNIPYKGKIEVTEFTISDNLFYSTPPPLPVEIQKSFITADSNIELKLDGLYVDGNKKFLICSNDVLVNYGSNFPILPPWFPKGQMNISNFKKYLTDHLKNINKVFDCVRVSPLFSDFRGILTPDADIYPDRVDAFLSEIDVMFEIFQETNLVMSIVLFDFLALSEETPVMVNGIQIGGRQEFLFNEEKRQIFYEKLLIPILQKIEDLPKHKVLFISAFNEHPWIIKQGVIDEEQFKSIYNEIVALIREYAPKTFVIGGANVQNLSYIEGLDIDVLGVHYYDSAGNPPQSFLEEIKRFNLPVMLEESPSKNSIYDIIEFISFAYDNDFIGSAIWNTSCGIDNYTIECKKMNEMLMKIYNWKDSILIPDN